jgi:Tfp pilus assembly protein FimT
VRAGKESSSGQGLVDLLVAITVAVIVAATALPVTTAYVHEARLRGAAFHVRGLFRQARARAAAEARYVGIVFDEVEGDPVFSVYGDSNSNGIRRADIDRGVEEKLREPYRLTETFPGVRYGSLPAGAAEPFFPGLKFGRSQIVSFSPLGSSTSGTLYLSNEYGLVYAVVVLGSTGRVRVARYRGGKWQAM